MRRFQEFVICPNMIVLRDNKVLLLRRAGRASLYQNTWHCPIGAMEEGESPKETVVRETFEEVGLKVDPALGTSVWVNSYSFKNPKEKYRDLSLFFVAAEFEGEPENKEPHLHDAMDWFEVDKLPDPMIPVVRFGIEQYLSGANYGEFFMKP